MASLRETFRFWTLSRGDCVAIEEWLRESGLSLGDFFASFINFCAKVANRAQDPGTKNRTPEEGRILDIVRAYPTSVNDLISAMKWYYEAKYEVDGQAWGNIPIREGCKSTFSLQPPSSIRVLGHPYDTLKISEYLSFSPSICKSTISHPQDFVSFPWVTHLLSPVSSSYHCPQCHYTICHTSFNTLQHTLNPTYPY